MGSRRVLIYSQDGLGLGHQRRTWRIAGQLLRAAPGTSILTLCDSPLGGFFPRLPGQRYLRLPTLIKQGGGLWSTFGDGELRRVCQRRGELIRGALAEFRPDVVLVDHMPHGACGELLPALELRRRHGCRRLVLGLRDILDDPQVTRQRWESEGAYAALRDHYDQILVYGQQEVFDTGRLYGLPSSIPLEYCGYVAPPETDDPAHRLRRRCLAGSPADTKLLLATAGGGADAWELMDRLLDCLPAIEAQERVRLVMVLGPHFPEDRAASIRARAEGQRVHVLGSTRRMVPLLRAAHAVVAMVGYNTTMELLRSRTPALVVPRPGPSAEQRLRAEGFGARRWLRVLDPERLATAAFAESVVGVLRQPAGSVAGAPCLEGAGKAAHRMLLGMRPTERWE